MSSVPAENPICYRLMPDRRLLEGKCQHHECAARYAARRETTSGLVEHDIPPCLLGHQQHTVIGYDGLTRLALMVTPEGGGDFRDQAWEAISTLRAIIRQQSEPMVVTTQTVFVADAGHVMAARRLFKAYYGDKMPLTVFVVQPPCDGRGIAIEAWAISTRTAKVKFVNSQLVTISHDGLHWIHALAGSLAQAGQPPYEQAAEVFESLREVLMKAGASFEEVVRTWLYQGGITHVQGDIERYRELNRARSDFFAHIPFHQRKLVGKNGRAIYPASTGIGTHGHGLMATCMALQTERDDVKLLPLENPLQRPSFDYPEHYSVKTPKFSRAMAVRIGDHVTTWVSGTASIVNSETVFKGDVEKQTEQTLTNIERLIDADNFARLGLSDAGATLDDLAKIRIYVKHQEDYEKCRAVVERRLRAIPAIYAQADVCRPDLLVEIEGVAFSPIRKTEGNSERRPS